MSHLEQQIIAYLRTPAAIRHRCDRIFTLGCEDKLRHFWVDLTQLHRVADYVIQVTRNNYPDLNIPFHSRWRHFEVGNVPRLEELAQALAGLTPLEKAQVKFDLVMTSVLLDAGAGADWQYRERETGLVFRRSEGLAVASFRMFCQGTFSSNPDFPWQADADGLQNLTEQALALGFQVSQTNPLIGVAGRVKLLQRLGQVLASQPKFLGTKNPRPGHLVNDLLETAKGKSEPPLPPLSKGEMEKGKSEQESDSSSSTPKTLPSTLSAVDVLNVVLSGLGEIWPGRLAIAGVNLGDVWIHPTLQVDRKSDGYVPFHKLSMWLTYSLLEPLQELGLEITGLDELTGLPEYRNGGLCLDMGLIRAKHSAVLHECHSVESEVIVEWRALTVSLLDKIAAAVRQKLNLSAAELPLVKVLQGGTWSAGRRIASELREGGVPPIQIESDGTVF